MCHCLQNHKESLLSSSSSVLKPSPDPPILKPGSSLEIESRLLDLKASLVWWTRTGWVVKHFKREDLGPGTEYSTSRRATWIYENLYRQTRKYQILQFFHQRLMEKRSPFPIPSRTDSAWWIGGRIVALLVLMRSLAFQGVRALTKWSRDEQKLSAPWRPHPLPAAALHRLQPVRHELDQPGCCKVSPEPQQRWEANSRCLEMMVCMKSNRKKIKIFLVFFL